MAQQWVVTVTLCIQNSINKMHLCSLSITYAFPYHNPSATMGHLIHNVDISKPLTHTMPYTLSAICPVQWKPRFIREENTSPKCQTPSNVSICPLKSVTTNCSQVETPMRTTSMQMSFTETVSDSLCRKSLVIWLSGKDPWNQWTTYTLTLLQLEQTTDLSGRRGTGPPTEPGFSQGFFSILSPMEFSFLAAVASGLLSWGHLISSTIIDLIAQILFKLN